MPQNSELFAVYHFWPHIGNVGLAQNWSLQGLLGGVSKIGWHCVQINRVPSKVLLRGIY